MSLEDCKPSSQANPPSISDIQDQIRSHVKTSSAFVHKVQTRTFYQVERSLHIQISSLACLFFQRFLMSFHEQFD